MPDKPTQKRCFKLATGVTVVLASLGGWPQGILDGPAAEPKRPAANLTPRIVYLDGHGIVDLPASLVALLRSEFAAYRVPSPSDMSGAWEEPAGRGPLPFAAWGDYDGNGLIDVALILLGKHDWKIVAFHQLPAARYSAHVLQSGPVGTVNADNGLEYPKDRLISTVKKATRLSLTAEPGEQTGGPAFFDHDSICLTMSDSGRAFYHWDGKRYELQEESSE